MWVEPIVAMFINERNLVGGAEQRLVNHIIFEIFFCHLGIEFYFLLRQVEVLAARRWNLQSWRHKAIWLEPSIAELDTHNVWTATLARTSIACSRLQCKLYACKSLCIFISLNVIYLCLLGLALQKYALFWCILMPFQEEIMDEAWGNSQNAACLPIRLM